MEMRGNSEAYPAAMHMQPHVCMRVRASFHVCVSEYSILSYSFLLNMHPLMFLPIEANSYTCISLATPYTCISLATSYTRISLATPYTRISLATPYTCISLATSYTRISLATPYTCISLRATRTCMLLMPPP